MNFYNEIDEKAAAWLRELIKEGMLAPGIVDTRDIRDITPQDLGGFTQCHFFAGIGGWPYALDLAGWPRDRPVWTGSCPCQPLSQAGKGLGFDDERHLWPSWHWLVDQCRPDNLFGEQVASPLGLLWSDLVRHDLEGSDYAFWISDLCAAGIEAPHIRQRLWWLGVGLADTASRRRREFGDAAFTGSGGHLDGSGIVGGLGHPTSERHPWAAGRAEQTRLSDVEHAIDAGGMAYSNCSITELAARNGPGPDEAASAGTFGQPERHGDTSKWSGAAPVDWRDADWLLCRDGKWRPVEPGTFPLAHGISGRMGLLRGYGNAIVPLEAAEFVAAWLDHERATA